MEVFYELMLKNGFCFLVGTNQEGICEFSINGYEFAIYTFMNGEGEVIDFSFSAATDLAGGVTPTEEYPLQEGLSVLSVKKVDEKTKRRFKDLNRKPNESIKARSFHKKGLQLLGQATEFCAHRGSVNTPNGWICA